MFIINGHVLVSRWPLIIVQIIENYSNKNACNFDVLDNLPILKDY
jgi:hypothetical protein